MLCGNLKTRLCYNKGYPTHVSQRGNGSTQRAAPSTLVSLSRLFDPESTVWRRLWMSKIEVRTSTFANGELFLATRVHHLDSLPSLRTLTSIKDPLRNAP